MNIEAFNISNGTSQSGVSCNRDNTMARVLFPILYTLLFFTGAILNILSTWVFFQIPSTSFFVIYLKSTLLADLVMCLMLPFKIATDSGVAPWQVKAFVCRFSAVVFYVTMYISIIMLGLIALDRFLKIVQPFGKPWIQNVTLAKIISTCVWLVMFGLSLPNITLTNKEATPSSVRKCSSLKNQAGLQWHAAVNYVCQFIFWAVFVLIILFYTIITKKVYESYKNSKSRAVETKNRLNVKVFIVVAVFFVCFAPFHFTRVPYTLSQTGGVSDCRVQKQLFIAKEGTLWLAATNICMDPIIYIFLCRAFREKLICMLLRRDTSSSRDTAVTQINNETTM
ncbi:P2Y purinoceptor 13-like [Ambystoma mexicanum]|uniref:P2Y purinoceptor 13-like n=1 Tax=Ambystoma mexicanum TaxID=8296 RepID=UPI0037E9C998